MNESGIKLKRLEKVEWKEDIMYEQKLTELQKKRDEKNQYNQKLFFEVMK
jgi:hypothetical protein